MVEESMRASISFLLVLALALLACKRHPPSGGSATTTGPTSATTIAASGGLPVLSETYTSKNGLLTAHYPAAFAAKTVGTSSIVVARNLSGGLDEAIAFVPIENPISNEVREFARVIGSAEVKELNGYVESSSRPATCVGSPGIETTGTWRSERGTQTYVRKACHFIHHGHGYSIAYSVPSTRAADEEPTLRAIREATQLNR
jgi:hypothetical protein